MAKKLAFRDEREWAPFYEELGLGSDRVCAIVGCTMIDNSLTSLIASSMIKNDDKAIDEFLSNLNMKRKVELAYCLDLITKHQKEDIFEITHIRNRFAHVLHDASFENETIKKMCERLKPYYEKFMIENDSSRKYFQMAVAMLVYEFATKSM